MNWIFVLILAAMVLGILHLQVLVLPLLAVVGIVWLIWLACTIVDLDRQQRKPKGRLFRIEEQGVGRYSVRIDGNVVVTTSRRNQHMMGWSKQRLFEHCQDKKCTVYANTDGASQLSQPMPLDQWRGYVT